MAQWATGAERWLFDKMIAIITFMLQRKRRRHCIARSRTARNGGTKLVLNCACMPMVLPLERRSLAERKRGKQVIFSILRIIIICGRKLKNCNDLR